MIAPDFKTFAKLARHGNLVPVYETISSDLLTPVSAWLKLAAKAKYSFLLESVEGGEKIARYTFLGSDPIDVFRYRLPRAESPASTSSTSSPSPWDSLRARLAKYKPVRIPGLPPLTGGAIGYFSYDMVRLAERIPASGRDDLQLDDAVLMFYLGLIAFDRVRHRVWIIRNVFTEGPGRLRAKYDAAVREIERDRRLLEQPLPVRRRTPAAAPRLASNSARRISSALSVKRKTTSAPATSSKPSSASASRRKPPPTLLRFTAPSAWSILRPTCITCDWMTWRSSAVPRKC